MARKVDVAAAKQRQQRTILIVLGVVFVGLAAFQGPKLMKQLKGNSNSSAAPAVTTPADGSGTTTTPTSPGGGTTAPAVVTGSTHVQSAKVAGVILKPAGPPAAGTGQLWSLSRFKAKDPFVQQVKVATAASGPAGSAAPGSSPVSGPTPNGQAAGASGVLAKPTTTTPTVLGYATLIVNGKAQQLQLKQLFPKGLPTFVLLAVDKGSVKIGVAGGKFTDGAAVKLVLGKRVTLMNTTTGQRFVMKLVFTGAQPEQIAGFKVPAATLPAGTTPTTATAKS
ncbi:MAG: hypothetical protein E6G14_05640 [Actinobacteria bacterium]|nr:MAG: hypothetical protein E6G14_05640 [Actinomycetota bacterium]